MDRLACVDIPALPLQLLLLRQPRWAELPAAVVDRDRPQGEILWVNEHARRLGALPGQRYATALALARELRAGEVAQSEIDNCINQLVERLRRFTPEIEPAANEAGVFWLSASGLQLLFPSLETWGEGVHADLHLLGLRARVVIGFTRFGTYAVAKARPRKPVLCFTNQADEQRCMQRVGLDRLALPPEARERLAALAVRSVGDFLRLPPGGVLRRFGPEVHRLYELATGEKWDRLQPVPEEAPCERRLVFDDPERDRESLLFLIKRELDPLLSELAERGEALTTLQIVFEGKERIEAELRPAQQTLDAALILGLVRLRLESLELAHGATGLHITATGARATAEQLHLFEAKPKRDLRAAARAIARIRAALGERAVVRAQLREGHLPEAGFSWEPIEPQDWPPKSQKSALKAKSPQKPATNPLIRRFLPRPLALPPRPKREPDGWLLCGLAAGPVEKLLGPYVLSGGWWGGENSREITRDYYYAVLRSGDCIWIYYDHKRQTWYQQGKVA